MKDFFANSAQSERGYGVVNGDEVPQVFIEKFAIPSTVRVVAIGTDGYPKPGESLAEVEALLAQALAQDPLMIDAYRGPKGLMPGKRSYDDRTFISAER